MGGLGWLVKLLFVVALLGVGLLTATLIANRPPLFDPPGPVLRLSTYLTRNSIRLSPVSPYPELRPRLYDAPPERTYRQALEAMHDLGWEVVLQDDEHRRAHAVITTPLLRFQDDFRVEVVAEEHGLSSLQVESSSRVGKSDFAANTRHLLDFREALERRLMEQE